jgi:hypothetical protein
MGGRGRDADKLPVKVVSGDLCCIDDPATTNPDEKIHILCSFFRILDYLRADCFGGKGSDLIRFGQECPDPFSCNITGMTAGNDKHGMAYPEVFTDGRQLREYIMPDHDIPWQLHPLGFPENFIFQYFYTSGAHSYQK